MKKRSLEDIRVIFETVREKKYYSKYNPVPEELRKKVLNMFFNTNNNRIRVIANRYDLTINQVNNIINHDLKIKQDEINKSNS